MSMDSLLDNFGSVLRMPGSRPSGGADAPAAQPTADTDSWTAPAADDDPQTATPDRQRELTEATNANAFIHAQLLQARARYQADPDYSTLAQRWTDESHRIIETGLSRVSNDGLREHILGGLQPSLTREYAAIQQQAFQGVADAHAAARENYISNLAQYAGTDPDDPLYTGGIDAYHATLDNAVDRGLRRTRARRSVMPRCGFSMPRGG
jgi:hypothetical protein